jgi:hypothetical protein
MSNWAELDKNNIVIRVIVFNDSIIPEHEVPLWISKNIGGKWLQASYNRNIRKNFPGPGYFYDEGLDAFIPPRPSGSDWILDEGSGLWQNPELSFSMSWVPEHRQFLVTGLSNSDRGLTE